MTTSRVSRFSLVAVAMFFTSMFFTAATAMADPPGPVTACATDTQTGAGLNLAQALAAGGVVRFNCPAGSAIRVTGRYLLKGSTLIDGGDTVALDGHGAFGPMLTANGNVILRRLTIRGFAQRPLPVVLPPFIGIGRITGSVLAARGDAELDRVTIETSDFPVDVRGAATVLDSTFIGNRGTLTVVVRGTAHIERSRFTGNGQALQIGAGWVRSCDFNGQRSGAVRVNSATGPVEIRHSTFTGTRGRSPLEISQRASGSTTQTITVRANVFRDNDGGAAAGAISLVDVVQEARDRGASAAVISALAALPPASFALSYNRFAGNRGGRGGAIAANLSHTAGMISTGDLFVGNAASGEGGAVVVSGGALRMSHALFKANRAGGRGAALAVMPDAAATLANSLVAGNAGPAGAISGRAITLANVTIADNAAAGLMLEGAAANAANLLLARNRPADCVGVLTGVLKGSALQSDGSCPGVAVGEAYLDAFYVPSAGSPALTAGDPAVCRGADVGGVDLPFQGRVSPNVCALGAFERPPVRKFAAAKTDEREVHADSQDDFSDDEGYQPSPGSTGGNGYPWSTGNDQTCAVIIALAVCGVVAYLCWRAWKRKASSTEAAS